MRLTSIAAVLLAVALVAVPTVAASETIILECWGLGPDSNSFGPDKAPCSDRIFLPVDSVFRAKPVGPEPAQEPFPAENHTKLVPFTGNVVFTFRSGGAVVESIECGRFVAGENIDGAPLCDQTPISEGYYDLTIEADGLQDTEDATGWWRGALVNTTSS